VLFPDIPGIPAFPGFPAPAPAPAPVHSASSGVQLCGLPPHLMSARLPLYWDEVIAARRIMAGLGVLQVSDATFDQEVLQSEQPVLVDFWATWCGPCKAIGPIVESVAASYAGKLKVAKVNVDENAATPSRYGIRGIPALLFFKGGKVADQIVGFVPQNVIEEKIQNLLA
jgi:thioredoxin 1